MSKRESGELGMQGRPLPGESLLRQPGLADAAPEKEDGDAAGDFAFGITGEQIDALNLLIPLISAHGDVLAIADTGKLASHTVPLLGQAIVDATDTVSELLEQVEAQQLGPQDSPGSGAREGRGVYATWCPAGGRFPVPAHIAMH